ncbi:InlB B-repeat-containing protein, partial [Dokdonella sp.]|uniref:InlB B-repeat-containing protein n=1 Tax=Dokdonella sp. TaxID=2291710 RepID=UPI0031CA2CD3|nr:hypothetical protein [Dokdonella sp.]
PASGYHVASVTGSTCTVTGSGANWSAANIQADCAVTATFAQTSYTVTASSAGNGTITPPTQTVNHGGTANFSVTPASGYHVASVTGSTCTVTGSGANWSAANIQADCAVTASFAPNVLVFSVQPADVMQGDTLVAVEVREEDGNGNPVTNDSTSVVAFTLPVCGGPLPFGSATMVNGVATLASSQVFYELAGNHVIRATSSGVLAETADSAPFAVVVNPDLVLNSDFDGCRP